MNNELTLMRESSCSVCRYPLIAEWTCLWGEDGGRHVHCRYWGDWTDMERAWEWLSDEDKVWLTGRWHELLDTTQ